MKTRKWTFKEIAQSFPQCQTLSEIISCINEEVWKSKSVVCEIRVNESFLSEEDEIKHAQMGKEQIQTIEVNTQTTEELIQSSVRSYIQFIPQIKQAAIHCSEDFRELKFDEGQSLFTDVLDGCRWMTDALFLLKSSIHKWDGFLELGPEWQELERQYSRVVNELVQAYETNDTQLLADVLEYELSNSLDGWVHVFEKIDQKVHG
ncbi:MAG: hypothetical protein KDD34_08665 [Bdellovibrionales bacterium]|nr:hypothetical protein [Bdellovibrionales bacterium]